MAQSTQLPFPQKVENKVAFKRVFGMPINAIYLPLQLELTIKADEASQQENGEVGFLLNLGTPIPCRSETTVNT